MKKLLSTLAFLLLGACAIQAQTLIGYYQESFFTGKNPDNRGVYTVKTPIHKKGAVLIRVHGATSIERIYILVEKRDIPAFITAMESAKIQFGAKEHIDYNFFPPVSIMWRDRKKHIWLEGGGYVLEPKVRYHEDVAYLSFWGDTKNNYLPELHSGNYFMMLKDSGEIEELLRLLRSEKLRRSLQNERMTVRPFTESKDY